MCYYKSLIMDVVTEYRNIPASKIIEALKKLRDYERSEDQEDSQIKDIIRAFETYPTFQNISKDLKSQGINNMIIYLEEIKEKTRHDPKYYKRVKHPFVEG